MDKLAIALMSFNRPHYFEQVLDSLSKQIALEDIPVYCFQDGAINKISGISRANQTDIVKSSVLFKKYFPSGYINQSEYNLGVALNFDKAENFLFNDECYDAVLFLEDDMVLRPNYLTVIKLMLSKYGNDDRVGMISAYGSYPLNSIEIQHKHRHKLCPMEHNWGFCLTKRMWKQRQPILSGYLDIISKVDYQSRPTDLISSWQKLTFGGYTVTSQDANKNLATALLKQIRITCFPNNALYIGKIGIHCNEITWNNLGYDNQVLYNDDITELEELTNEVYESIFTQQKIRV